MSDKPYSPILTLADILKDKTLTDEQKATLEKHWSTRFEKRRKMAYIALYTLIISFGVIVAIAVFKKDGAENLSQINMVISSTFLFLTGIVGAYFGTTAAKSGN